MYKYLFFLIIIFSAGYSSAQNIDNIRFLPETSQIGYNLVGSNPSEAFYVEIFLVSDAGRTKLSLLSGDAGYLVTPGNKVVVWDYENELIDFEGDISFEIIARPIFYFDENKTIIRRSKNVGINVLRSIDHEIKALYLLDKAGGKTLITDNFSIEAAAKTTWSIPGGQNVGSYRLQVETVEGILINGGTFKIQRRVSNFVKSIPVILITGWIIYNRAFAPLPEPGTAEELTGN